MADDISTIYDRFLAVFSARHPWITLVKKEQENRICIMYGNRVLICVAIEDFMDDYLFIGVIMVTGDDMQNTLFKYFDIEKPELDINPVAEYIFEQNILKTIEIDHVEKEALKVENAKMLADLSRLNNALPEVLQCTGEVSAEKLCNILIEHFQSLPGAPDYEEAKERFNNMSSCEN